MNGSFRLSLALAALLLMDPQAQATQQREVNCPAERTVPAAASESDADACLDSRATLAGKKATSTRTRSGDPQMWSWHEAARVAEPAAARARGPVERTARMVKAKPPIDASIRKIDRGGPGGATRLWLHNAGTQRAENCRVVVRRAGNQRWLEVQSVSIGAGQAVEIGAPMPRDSSLEFAATCPGEAPELLADNIAALQ